MGMSAAERVPRLHTGSTSKTMTNRLLIDVSARNKTFMLISFIILTAIEGLEEKEKVYSKTVGSRGGIRSRSPTLRKTETQDVFRTFVDMPEG